MRNFLIKIMAKAKTGGLTIMELVIVLAVIAIISAILMPNLFGIADRSRLRSDIQSTLVLRNAANLYRLERGTAPAGGDITTILHTLHTEGYLMSRIYYNHTQSDGAVWVLHNGNIYLSVPDTLSDHINNLSRQEQDLIRTRIDTAP